MFHADAIAACVVQGGRYTSVQQYSASEVLQGLCRTNYSLQELQEQPPPDGVDPSRLEDYLSGDNFEALMGMTRDEFGGLQPWRQLHLKKKANLF